MDKAKAAVSDFMSKAGHHDTSVHERVAPGVTNETVKPHQREERQIATDREVHQDHYHTSVQPVHDREVLPEQHHHNLVPVEHRTHDHRDHEQSKSRLQTEAAQFKDSSTRHETHHTSTAAPSIGGEHVHHHVHETIQPVVHKETIEPHVVHTTVPVHETHHNAAQHHTASALPAVHMADFKKQGGSLTGRDERVDHFSGEPKNIDHTLGNAMKHTGSGQHASLNSERGTTGTSGLGHEHTGHHGTSGLGNEHSSGLGNDRTTGTSGGIGSSNGQVPSTTSSTGTKPSLMSRLNPMKDSDGDGKKGLMD